MGRTSIATVMAGTVVPLLAACPAAAQTLSAQEVFRRVAPSVVVIEVKELPEKGEPRLIASGSGVVVPGDSKGGNRIVTNCHVFDESEGIVSVVQGNKWGIGFLHGRDDAWDMCLINAFMYRRLGDKNIDVSDAEGLKLPPARVSTSRALDVGDPVYAVGAPQGLELSLSDGLVSAFREYKGNQYIQTTAPISKGSSGGGLFDAQGRLVGITTMYVKDGQALNFAVPAELIASVPEVERVMQPVARKPVPKPKPKQRDRWWTFYEDNEREIAFDTETAKKEGRNMTVWTRFTFRSPQDASSGNPYTEMTSRDTFYCGSRQSSTSQTTLRNAAGEVVDSSRVESWRVKRGDVMPDTIGEEMYEAACDD